MAVEPFPYETGDESPALFSAVASGSSSGYVNIDKLEPNDSPMHLMYVIPGFQDGCRYQVKIPNGTDRMGIDDVLDIARLDNIKSPYYDPDEHFGFYIIHDMFPAFNAQNITPDSLTPKIWFIGWKYDLELVADPQLISRLKNFEIGMQPYVPCKLITLGGVS